MKIILILAAIMLSLGTQAACKSMAKKTVTKKLVEKPVTPNSYAKYQKAMLHYKSEIALDSEFKPKITGNSLYLKAGKVVGHEVYIDMGGDEDSVRYILNNKREIIVAYWSNQSPVTYWFCGHDDVQEVTETIEGEEIY